jgi:hypothetical protein
MTAESELKDAISAAMSPQAVALIVGHLQTVSGEHEARREVEWFARVLNDLVGGPVALAALFEEVGI